MPASTGRKGFSDAAQEPYSSQSASPATTEVTVHQAKTHLSRLLAQVEAGGSVIITRRGKPVAKLEAIAQRGPRQPGALKGLISIDERFFEPLPEEELRAWEGE